MKDIDEDTLTRMKRYCGHDPREPKEIEVEVFGQYGGEWSVFEFRKLICDAIDSIPAPVLMSGHVELGGEYDGPGSLKITYRRFENAEEVAKKFGRCLEYAREEQAQERAAYERLKKKFEG